MALFFLFRMEKKKTIDNGKVDNFHNFPIINTKSNNTIPSKLPANHEFEDDQIRTTQTPSLLSCCSQSLEIGLPIGLKFWWLWGCIWKAYSSNYLLNGGFFLWHLVMGLVGWQCGSNYRRESLCLPGKVFFVVIYWKDNSLPFLLRHFFTSVLPSFVWHSLFV